MTWQIDEGARDSVIIPVLKLIDNEWTANIRLRDTISLATSHSAVHVTEAAYCSKFSSYPSQFFTI